MVSRAEPRRAACARRELPNLLIGRRALVALGIMLDRITQGAGARREGRAED